MIKHSFGKRKANQFSSGLIFAELVFARIALPNSCRKPFETVCRLAGIVNLRFHDRRATFISRAIERNVSPEVVRKVSGRKQDKAFQRYLRFSKKSLNEAFSPFQ